MAVPLILALYGVAVPEQGQSRPNGAGTLRLSVWPVLATLDRFSCDTRAAAQVMCPKKRDWLAEKIGFELVVAFRCTASSKLDFDSWESRSLDGVRIHNVVDAKAPSFNKFNRLPEGDRKNSTTAT